MQWSLPLFDCLLLDGTVQIRTVIPAVVLRMKPFS